MTFNNAASYSRQRLVVATAKFIDDQNNDENNLAECSSVSSEEDARDEKYNKSRRRQRQHQYSRRINRCAHHRVIRPRAMVGIFLVLVMALISWNYIGAQQQNHRRHNNSNASLYERAGLIIQNLSKTYNNRPSSHFQARRPEDDNLRHNHKRRNFDSNNAGGVPQISTSRADASVPSLEALQASFAKQRLLPEESLEKKESIPKLLSNWLKRWDEDIIDNVHGGIRLIRPYLLPGKDESLYDDYNKKDKNTKIRRSKDLGSELFRASRSSQVSSMKWFQEYKNMIAQYGGEEKLPGPIVDYTDPNKYEYPPIMDEPPTEGGYPRLIPLGDMMHQWDQDEDKHGMITETLLHFDFSNPAELAKARKFRDAMLPFKLYNVPEIDRATGLWTDAYVSRGFGDDGTRPDRAQGTAQESTNHYFAFYTPPNWVGDEMGVPPVRNNDMKFSQWAMHARYADATRLETDQPHFYWQSGVPRDERYSPKSEWSFISRDLPSFSATEENFIMFHPEEQKGVQCRFGERGVVAATHYDSGRNMIGMITGAKRYILSPPNACGKLGLFADHHSPIYRHSLLNFGHIKYLDEHELSKGMSEEEREWLERAASAPAVETVLKAGEILYLPSFWFHYIVSVQKSAQCNARSGIQEDQHWEFGGMQDVKECPLV